MNNLNQQMHMFNIEIANEYGIEEAIILQNISFWIDHNKANDKNFHDGHYWTYNSAKAFQKIFPYMSEYKIKRVLKKLEEEEILLTGNYNKSSYDRTKWYTLSKKGEMLLQNPKKAKETLKYEQSAISTDGEKQNQPMEKTKSTNGKNKIDRPIPDINTDKKLDINHIISYQEKNSKEIGLDRIRSQNNSNDFDNIIHQVKEQINYDYFKGHKNQDKVDELVFLMADVLTTTKNTIRVMQENKPAEIVKGVYKKIKNNHIQYVLMALANESSKINNMKAYLTTTLYNSLFGEKLYYENKINNF